MKYETWIKKCEEWTKNHPDLSLPFSLRFYNQPDKYQRFIDKLERDLFKTVGYDVTDIESLPEPHRSRVILLLIDYVVHRLRLLKETGGQGLVDELMDKMTQNQD